MVQSTAAPPTHAVSQLPTKAVIARHCLQIVQLASKLGQAARRHFPHFDAGALWFVHQPHKLAHLLDDEPELAAATDEDQRVRLSNQWAACNLQLPDRYEPAK